MGGDHAPKAEVERGGSSRQKLGVRVILVGQEDVVRAELDQHHDGCAIFPIEIVTPASASPWRTAPRKPSAPRRDSSMRVASRLVRDGVAQGFVSAGNTGAVMATAKMVQGVVPGVDRPALAGVFPTAARARPWWWWMSARTSIAIPQMLAQFAVMGEIYSRIILGTHQSPRGPAFHRRRGAQGQRAHPRRHAAAEGLPLNFIGNVEGRDIYTRQSRRDRLRRLHRQCRAEGERRPGGHGQADAAGIAAKPPSPGKIGYVLVARIAFTDFKKRVDYSEYRRRARCSASSGVCIICHGRSNANAIKNAIRVAAEFASGDINRKIEEGLNPPYSAARAN